MNDPRQRARTLLQDDAITLKRLWILYWGEGGEAEPLEFDAYLHGALSPPMFELTVMGWALEALGDLPRQ